MLTRSSLLALVVAAFASASVACTHTTEWVDEPTDDGDVAEKKPAPKAEQTSATSTKQTEAKLVSAPAASPEPANQCGAKTSREDCMDCCAIAGGASCKAQCETKPAADDCRTNSCSGGASCQKCMGGWSCMAAGSKC